MLNYFKSCKTAEDVKKKYHELVKAYHPDLHDEKDFEYYNKIMQKVNAEYDIAWGIYKNVHATANGETTYEKKGEQATTEIPETFKAIINALIHCEGLTIDLVGSWVWVTGNTYTHKQTLKDNGFKWANAKKAWYWHADDDKPRRHSKMTLDEIKDVYGCETFKATSRVALQG